MKKNEQGPFRVEGGFALISEQEFENFRLLIIERCAKEADKAAAFGSVGLGTPAAIAASIRKLKDEDLWMKTLEARS